MVPLAWMLLQNDPRQFDAEKFLKYSTDLKVQFLPYPSARWPGINPSPWHMGRRKKSTYIDYLPKYHKFADDVISYPDSSYSGPV